MEKIIYHDRYRDLACEEKVYGDKALRWTYGTLGGRLSLHALVKRAWFSRWYGWRMDRPASREKIAPFIETFELDPDEFAKRPSEFASFNEFFSRKLKPDARPIDPRPSSVVFPADGRHLCIPKLSQCDGLFVKGEMFDLAELLQDRGLTQRFEHGSLPVSYTHLTLPTIYSV